jgi:hypothetical protein
MAWRRTTLPPVRRGATPLAAGECGMIRRQVATALNAGGFLVFTVDVAR